MSSVQPKELSLAALFGVKPRLDSASASSSVYAIDKKKRILI